MLASAVCKSVTASNRTSLELKQLQREVPAIELLIAPAWN